MSRRGTFHILIYRAVELDLDQIEDLEETVSKGFSNSKNLKLHQARCLISASRIDEYKDKCEEIYQQAVAENKENFIALKDKCATLTKALTAGFHHSLDQILKIKDSFIPESLVAIKAIVNDLDSLVETSLMAKALGITTNAFVAATERIAKEHLKLP